MSRSLYGSSGVSHDRNEEQGNKRCSVAPASKHGVFARVTVCKEEVPSHQGEGVENGD